MVMDILNLMEKKIMTILLEDLKTLPKITDEIISKMIKWNEK